MMASLPKTGWFYPNRFVRITLKALIEVVGENGMHAVFRLANQPGLIETLPPDNESKEFDTADFSAIFQTLDEIFGVHGGRGLAFRAGKMTFNEELKYYGQLYGVMDLPQKDIPVQEKIQHGLSSICSVFNMLTDQHLELTHLPGKDQWLFTVHDCAICAGRHASMAVCSFTEGLLDEAAFYFSGGSKLQVEEIQCIAASGEACQYLIQIPQPENPPFKV